MPVHIMPVKNNTLTKENIEVVDKKTKIRLS